MDSYIGGILYGNIIIISLWGICQKEIRDVHRNVHPEYPGNAEDDQENGCQEDGAAEPGDSVGQPRVESLDGPLSFDRDGLSVLLFRSQAGLSS